MQGINDWILCGPECVAIEPAECYAPVVCTAQPPLCPPTATPAVVNGCWSGYCLPTSECETVACEDLPTEQACIARPDCSPVYRGMSCTCSPSGCVCQVLTYDRCE